MGFNPAILSEALGLFRKEERAAADAETMAKFDNILEATARAVGQIPNDRLEFSSPDRERNMREFGFHIFDFVDQGLEGYKTQKFELERLLKHKENSLRFKSAGEIVQWGREVRAKVQKWGRALKPGDLDRPIDAYFGKSTMADLLGLMMGHSTHHTKQLYAFLKMMGIEPINPLTEKDVEGIEVPTQLF